MTEIASNMGIILFGWIVLAPAVAVLLGSSASSRSVPTTVMDRTSMDRTTMDRKMADRPIIDQQ